MKRVVAGKKKPEGLQVKNRSEETTTESRAKEESPTRETAQ